MHIRLLFLSFLFFQVFCFAQQNKNYRSLDASQPIQFSGKSIVFNNDTITLDKHALFIDGNLSDAEAAKYPFVYNSVKTAAAHLTNGTEAEPMVLYLAPWVYWIDNPDDTATRVPKPGNNTPYGMEITCEWLRFHGLNSRPENVVLASNRGQTIGAKGNFTMFRFAGEGTGSENITFGNYCNVDLVFPLKPALGRQKRASAIVQAQLIHCNGDKIVARNTRFISRLNLCPFVGGKRVLFDRCHFESTDDALCGTGVYLNSTLDFYSSKPFYNTRGTGAVLLNCSIRSYAGKEQFFTKAGGQVAVIDSRFTSDKSTYFGWQDAIPPQARNYEHNNTMNGKSLVIGKADPLQTIDLIGKKLLDAYRFKNADTVVYNTYNLLKGDDDWDPMRVKPLLQIAEQKMKRSLSGLPVQLAVSPATATAETKKNAVILSAKLFRFGNYISTTEKINWAVAAADEGIVQLKLSDDGNTCTVIPMNTMDDGRQVMVTASTASGLEGASLVNVLPEIMAAPQFSSKPVINLPGAGVVNVFYTLDTKYADESDVRWYRCTNAAGAGAIEVAVSRDKEPFRTYTLSAGDVGYWLAASVSPKHSRSLPAKAVWAVMKKQITKADVPSAPNILETDFKNVSVANQPSILPGFFTWDNITPGETDPANNNASKKDAWYFGEGADGAAGMVGLLQARHAGMWYTPVEASPGNMKLTMKLAPFKTAGQGFSVAHLYMDVLIKFDAKTMTGYALRLIRTTKYGNAVDCILLQYKNGEVTALTEPITTSAFRTPCTITLEINGNQFSAEVNTLADTDSAAQPGVQKAARLETTVNPARAAGFGIHYHGGSPTMIKHLKAEW